MEQKEKVIDALMERIITESYPHGSRLAAERALCQDLSTSRSSLREGLTVLTNWNVVKPEKGSGIKVMGQSLWHMQTIPFLMKYEIGNDVYPQLISELLTIRRKIFLDVLTMTKRKKKLQLSAAKKELDLAWENRMNLGECTLHESNFIREVLIAADLHAVILLWNSISEIYVAAANMIPVSISIPKEYITMNTKLVELLEKGRTLMAVNLVDRYLKRQDKEILKFVKALSNQKIALKN